MYGVGVFNVVCSVGVFNVGVRLVSVGVVVVVCGVCWCNVQIKKLTKTKTLLLLCSFPSFSFSFLNCDSRFGLCTVCVIVVVVNARSQIV